MLCYDDTVKYEFVESSHKHMVSKLVKDDLWTVPTPVMGCTTVTGVINKPFLMLWPMNEAIKHLNSWWANMDKTVTDADWKVVVREAANAHKKKSDSGKHVGHIGHALAEALIQNKKVIMPKDKDLLKQAESIRTAFESFVSEFKPEPVYIEQGFYSLRHNYAGICDMVATIDGKLTVVDYKTTNTSRYNPDGIYAENYAQLGGYIIGLEEMLGIKVEEAMIVNLPKDGTEYKLKSLSDMGLSVEDAKSYFLNALGLHEAHKTFGWRLGQ